MATASWLIFRTGRYLTWARLGRHHPGFEEMAWTTHDGMPVASFAEDQPPTLGEFLCRVELEQPE
jgi:hypothetical protein